MILLAMNASDVLFIKQVGGLKILIIFNILQLDFLCKR